jgi:predicted phosphodiesterase
MPEIVGVEVTTVSDDEIVLHYVDEGKSRVKRYEGLRSDSEIEIGLLKIKTFPKPPGELLCRFATVNDVHIGEKTAGLIEGFSEIEGISSEPGEIPYPTLMSMGAVDEISHIKPEVVLAKGDLTSGALDSEFNEFKDIFGGAFNDRLFITIGNHDAKSTSNFSCEVVQVINIPGLKIVLIDTSITDQYNGQIKDSTIDAIDEIAHESQTPVLIFGHHNIWNPSSRVRPETYFGVNPTDSEKFVSLMGNNVKIKGYFAGHTHRNRVRRFDQSMGKPYVEVAALKDFPGSWAEYKVYEGGVLQVHRRLSSIKCLDWSDRCRNLYGGRYAQYSFGELEDRCFRVF